MASFEISDMGAQPFAFLTRTADIKGISKVMAESFSELGRAFAMADAPMMGPPLCHYTAYDGATTRFEVGFPYRPEDADRLRAAGLTLGTTRAGKVMKATHVGPYDTVVETYDAMQADMAARKLVGADDMWEVYMSPPETPPDKIVTEVMWPVTEAA